MRVSKSRTSMLLLAGCLAAAAAGCSAASTAGGASTTRPVETTAEIASAVGAPATTTRSVDVAREILTSIDGVMRQVAAERGVVVVGAARSSEEIPGNATPDGTPIERGSDGYIAATRAHLDVTDVLFGAATEGATLTVRQHGAPYEVLSALPKMRDGHSYLVFLKPFEYGPGKPTGDWTVVGLDAIWEDGTSGEFRLVAPADGTEPRYPATWSLTEARQLVNRVAG